MIYPKIYNLKTGKIAIKIVSIISIVIILICSIINILTTPKIKWSLIVILEIIYAWIVTMYSIKKNTNIAAHTLLQLITVSALTILLDNVIGYKGWAVTFAIPIIISIANIIMFILAIVNYRRYFKYAIYQIVIAIISILLILFVIVKFSKYVLPVILTSAIVGFSLLTAIIFHGKDLKDEMIRLFHI